jgi:UPF0176 protein
MLLKESAENSFAQTVEKNPFRIISGYCFAELQNLEALRLKLLDFCKNNSIRGTILLSEEGVNCSASGTCEAIQKLRDFLRTIEPLQKIEFKEHSSWRQPFKNIYVKIRKEIISMGIPKIQVDKFSAPSISPKLFAEWMDQNKAITILDTRNDYEVKRGKFKNALDLNVKTFKEFAKRVSKLPQNLKDKPMVMYCTGGIRCEKASAYLLKEHGFKEIYQLRGGILQYFKEVGSKYFDGECVVFDQRGGIDQAESETRKCFRCSTVLSESEVREGKLKAFSFCFHCAPKAIS